MFRTARALSALGLLTGAGTAAAQVPTFACPDITTLSFTGSVQDYRIPALYGRAVELRVEGGDGGDASRRFNGNEADRVDGGEGATAVILCRVGTGTNEIAPGGTLRFIVGGAGEEYGSDSFVSLPGFSDGYGGAGGGGSAVLYLPPGETDWNNSIILVAAGGGGGGAIIWGPTSGASSSWDGGNAQTGTCGGDPTEGCDGDQAQGGCDGQAGGYHDEGEDNGEARRKAGGGAFSFNGQELGGRDGFPFGGRGGTGIDGGWGFGGGGAGGVEPGGGGGYSGGASYDLDEYNDIIRLDCNGGAGGGGSFVNDAYDLRSASTPAQIFEGNSGDQGIGTFLALSTTTNNNVAAGAVEIGNGSIAFASFCAATATNIPYCGIPVLSPDVWYTYTNTSTCPKAITITPTVNDVTGAAVDAGFLQILGYSGGDPTGTECRTRSTDGVYTDVVAPGERISLRVFSPTVANLTALLNVSVADAPIPNNEVVSPLIVAENQQINLEFCGTTSGTLDFTACNATLTSGFVAYYQFINPDSCPVDATFNLISGTVNDLRIFNINDNCREASIGQLSSRLGGGESMLVQIVSQSGAPISFDFTSQAVTGLPDCDLDGVPDACDPVSVCSVVNDDQANAIDLPLGRTEYSSAFATLDGMSSCSPADAGSTADIWFTHTAAEAGQLFASVLTADGFGFRDVGVSIFTEDGSTERGCDAGDQFDRIPNAIRQAVALASVRAGETVLIRVEMDDRPADNDLHSGSIWIDIDTAFTNDICSNAIVVTGTPGATTTVPFDLTQSQIETPDSCSPTFPGSTDFDLFDGWFSYTSTESGDVEFAAERSSNSALRGAIAVFDGCGGSVLACDAFSDGRPEPLKVRLSMAAGETVLIRVSALEFELGSSTFAVTIPESNCNIADIARPFGVLDLDDVDAFITAFLAQDAAADIAQPFGVLDLGDVDGFISSFQTGCP